MFFDMVEETFEIFMVDFSMVGDSFDGYLINWSNALNICEEFNLVLNWEKRHFMVNKGIVFGHKNSSKVIKVDQAK